MPWRSRLFKKPEMATLGSSFRAQTLPCGYSPIRTKPFTLRASTVCAVVTQVIKAVFLNKWAVFVGLVYNYSNSFWKWLNSDSNFVALIMFTLWNEDFDLWQAFGLLGRREKRVEKHATPRRDNSRILKQRRPTGKFQKVLNYVAWTQFLNFKAWTIFFLCDIFVHMFCWLQSRANGFKTSIGFIKFVPSTPNSDIVCVVFRNFIVVTFYRNLVH